MHPCFSSCHAYHVIVLSLRFLTMGFSVLFIQSDKIGKKRVTVLIQCTGSGSEELGKMLLRNYLIELADAPKTFDHIGYVVWSMLCTVDYRSSILRNHDGRFMNSGVFVTTTESEVIDALKKLVARGVKVASCGTVRRHRHHHDPQCLDFFNVRDKLLVGVVGNMKVVLLSIFFIN